MLTAFYKQKPTSDSPYRRLTIVAHEGSWRVRLSGGARWRPKRFEELKVIPVKTFEQAQKLYDKIYRQLQDEGWKPYNSCEPW